MDEREFEQQKELNAQMFGFAHGYIQGLVVVAYAGFFFLWDALEGTISAGFWALAGLLVAVSLLIYTAWEIFSFFFRQRLAMKLAGKIADFARDRDVEKWAQAREETVKDLVRFLPRMRRWWYPAMIAIVGPLACAWVILICGYAIKLLRTIGVWV